ncbi:MAG TPA: hypothetical protein VFS52_17000 [Steroidobacteraceae bacterium]|jgi:hypothetical protein|nr:hypothetical protein [Steroidobacteraceae bacterium]
MTADDTAIALTRQLDCYAHALRSLQPSAELDRRVDVAIQSWAASKGSRALWRRPLTWIAAVASIGAISLGVALLAMRDRGSAEGLSAAAARIPGLQVERVGVPALAAGQVSQWPAEAAIFRVKASFIPTGGFLLAGEQDGERQYWVDVRIANDGTMRIMQVVPAERGRGGPHQ